MFKNLVNLGVGIFFQKSQYVGLFSIFHAKLQFFAGLGARFEYNDDYLRFIIVSEVK